MPCHATRLLEHAAIAASSLQIKIKLSELHALSGKALLPGFSSDEEVKRDAKRWDLHRPLGSEPPAGSGLPALTVCLWQRP